MTYRKISVAVLPILALVSVAMVGCDSSSSSPTAPTSTTIGLNAATTKAMELAIDDEYKARAAYDTVMAKLGPIVPFVNIRAAEDSHVRALVVLFGQYGLTVPADPWAGAIEVPNTSQESCQLGVVAELENIAMYDGFFTYVTESDVLDVFNLLRSASLDQHLPAFELCS